jgi:membrane protease YdiL (CAAX protease family)
MEALRLAGPLLLALVAAVAVDQLTNARGLDPPAFVARPWRRAAGLAIVATTLWIGVFFALGQVGLPAGPMRTPTIPELFLLQVVFAVSIVAWFAVGHAGWMPPASPPSAVFSRQLGFATARPLREFGIGLGLGLLVWPALLLVLLAVVGVLVALGGEDVLPQQPPGLIVWIAALPVPVKLGVAACAGVVEEVFFRGFLQPRVGVGLSTLVFVLAHLSYDQPFMLVGITLLSLFFAALVEWRQNLWPAIAAHFLFDAVQLLFVIPWALEWSGQAAGGLAAAMVVPGPW